MRIRAKHYVTGLTVEILCDSGGITAIGSPTTAPSQEADWVAPALFDLQINGAAGVHFASGHLSLADIQRVVARCQRHGIAAFCPTLITGPFADLERAFRVLAQACATDAKLARAMPGFHLEGPYISPEDGPRGAHPAQHVRLPDWAEFCRLQSAAENRIRLVTLAPELPGALLFIEKATAAGVVIALGHTAATGKQIRDAVAAGARLSTHLGNGCHRLLPRHENYLWEQLADDRLWASLISDGHHLPPAVLKCLLRVKTPARSILTCDASSLAGLPPGRYREWEQDLEVLAEGKIVVAGTPYLAGSWMFTDQCLGPAIREAGITLAQAIDMASARPRELLGFPPTRLEVGHPATLMLFRYDPAAGVEVTGLVVDGRSVDLTISDSCHRSPAASG